MIRSAFFPVKSIALTALIGSSILGACSVLPKPAPPDVIYRLSALGEPVTPRAEAHVLQIDRPTAVGIFNSTAIVATPDGRRLASVAQAKWPQPIPSMVQQSVVDALRSSEELIGVLPSSGTRTDYRLHITIKNFEAQFDQGEGQAPLTVVQYTAELAKASDRKLLGTFSTRQTLRADATRVSAIVEAMEQTNDAALREIVEWLENISEDGQMAAG